MEHFDKKPNKEGNEQNFEKDANIKGEQQQTDPQITELKGFVDKTEDLEPTLQDGTKAPDKAPPPNVNK